jgi:hypothetical protein
MNTSQPNEYLLLFRGDEWYQRLSAEELQKVMDQSKAWFDRVAAQGKVKGGQPLRREGALVSGHGKSQRVLTDGPFVESKEAIGGYLVLRVDTLAEAIAIAKTSPALAHGTSIEVRPVAEECPLDARARQLVPQADLAHLAEA